MQALKTQLDTTASDYLEAKKNMQLLELAIKTLLKNAQEQGKEKQLATARKQGRLTGRERIELLLDQDSPFLELMPKLGYTLNMEKEGIKLVAGIGLVSGKLCLISANIGTLKTNLFDENTQVKSLRLKRIAIENRLPLVQLLESNEESVIPTKTTESPLEQTVSGINLVLNEAVLPLLQQASALDYTIFIKNRLPDALKYKADYLAENELDALRIIREVVDSFSDNHTFSPILIPTDIAPLHPIKDLQGMQFGLGKGLFDIRELMVRLVDRSEFTEYKAGFGKKMVAGFANIHGFPIGILANNAPIGKEEVVKLADFVRRCNQQHRSLLFIQNSIAFSLEILENAENPLLTIENALKNSTIPTLCIKIGCNKFTEKTPPIYGNAHQPRFLFSYLADLTHYDSNIMPSETRNHLAFALATIYNNVVEGEI